VPTYVSLINFTHQGITSIKEAPARLDAAKPMLAALGVELKAYYLTMGRHDVVTVVEAPDDTAVAKLLLTLGSMGNISTETLRAFTEDEFRQLIASLP
jgi:uncharacterized protein with GYD domain